MSKYKQFGEYTQKVFYKVVDTDDYLDPAYKVIDSIDIVLESYLLNEKPKECAKRIMEKEE